MNLNTVLRWVARVWSVVTFLFVLAFIVGGAESMRPTAAEAVALLFFPVGVIVGLAVAWWREGIGGAVAVCSLILFYAFTFARSGTLPGGPYFLLLAAPGFIHLANALLFRSGRGKGASGTAGAEG